VCTACALANVTYADVGRVRCLCHDCALAAGHWKLVQAHLPPMSSTSLLLRAANPPATVEQRAEERVKAHAEERAKGHRSSSSSPRRFVTPPMRPLPLWPNDRRWRDADDDRLYGDPVDPPHISERGKLKAPSKRSHAARR